MKKAKLCDNRDNFSPLQIYSSHSIHNQSNLSSISSSFSFKLYFFLSDPIRLNESIRISSFDRQNRDKKDSTVKIDSSIYSSLTIHRKSDFFHYLYFVYSSPTLGVMFLENVAESCDCMAKGYSGV